MADGLESVGAALSLRVLVHGLRRLHVGWPLAGPSLGGGGAVEVIGGRGAATIPLIGIPCVFLRLCVCALCVGHGVGACLVRYGSAPYQCRQYILYF